MAKNKEDWLKIGLATLSRDGIRGLTIDGMARQLRLTKGSFYHHFGNMAGFESQLIAYWADQALPVMPEASGNPAGGVALLDTVTAEAFNASASEIAVRTWAQQDDKAHRYMEQIDQARHAAFSQVFLSHTGDVIQARRMADILLTMLIGGMMAQPAYSPERFSILYAEFKRLYGLARAP